MIKPMALDILTDKKNLERILDNLKDGIIAHNMERCIFFFNREAERITGFQREEVLGRDCHEVFGSPFCGGQCSFCDNKVFPGRNKKYTVNITSKSGDPRRVDMSATLIVDESDAPMGVLASMRDVTELTRLKQKSGEAVRFSDIIARDAKMLDLFQQVREVADYDFPVHIFGETGVGKELVANAVHNESRRSGAPFVPINCGALPEGLIESELFGHVKGAFSGAIRDKKGRFELANRGTVFLDEVAELSKPMQVKLLRFLQEGDFEKVGGEKTITADVRIISATNKDLKKEIKRNKFREDFYYRLNVIPMFVPPLRERKSDIPLLVDYFLDQINSNARKRKDVDISNEALALMMDYQWPGNVRELQNAVQFSVVRCGGDVITPEALPMELIDMAGQKPKRGPSPKLEETSVKDAMIKTGWNKAKAARILGVGRATLYRFLRDHPDISEPAPDA
ncbi:MAG: PAS domain S-box protein [Desulfobacterales bacterium]|nr:PAS domain S-box protein [Desulfobacterales bacterium]